MQESSPLENLIIICIKKNSDAVQTLFCVGVTIRWAVSQKEKNFAESLIRGNFQGRSCEKRVSNTHRHCLWVSLKTRLDFLQKFITDSRPRHLVSEFLAVFCLPCYSSLFVSSLLSPVVNSFTCAFSLIAI
jgi:hypothetical protein